MSQQQGPAASGTSIHRGRIEHPSDQIQFSALYTPQKTQKRKRWHDGRLCLRGRTLRLFEACPAAGSNGGALGECELTNAQACLLKGRDSSLSFISSAIGTIEFEAYLCTVEGPWGSEPQQQNLALRSTGPSDGTKKVMSKKFRRPGRVPPGNSSSASNMQVSHGFVRGGMPQGGDLNWRQRIPDVLSTREDNPPRWKEEIGQKGLRENRGVVGEARSAHDYSIEKSCYGGTVVLPGPCLNQHRPRTGVKGTVPQEADNTDQPSEGAFASNDFEANLFYGEEGGGIRSNEALVVATRKKKPDDQIESQLCMDPELSCPMKDSGSLSRSDLLRLLCPDSKVVTEKRTQLENISGRRNDSKNPPTDVRSTSTIEICLPSDSDSDSTSSEGD